MFRTVKVCVGYQIKNKKITTFPLGFDDLNIAKPIYKEFNSWTPEEVASSRKVPKNLNIFIKFIENFLSTPILMISIGPERNQIVYL
jgi:adenylosuccinate synthase